MNTQLPLDESSTTPQPRNGEEGNGMETYIMSKAVEDALNNLDESTPTTY